MNRFIPGFLSSESGNNQQEEQNPMSDEPPLTRSRSANLQVPYVPGPDSIAARGRAASRSPSATAREQFFPAATTQTTMADETVQALASALQGMKVSSRKPELPAFDSKNIDLWLKRVDNAYRRAGITDPKDKFAFVEPKFAVDTDPRINELLFGDGTADEWQEFEKYLRSRYGRTKAQQASIILDGTPRDGKLPSEYFAHIKERIGSLTVDDIIKEMVLRELPTEIRRTIHDKVKDADGATTVELADQYFDKDGKPLHKSTNPAVNAVDNPPDPVRSNSIQPDPVQTDNEPEDINAINSRRFQKPNRQFRPQQSQQRHVPQQSQQRSFPPSRPTSTSYTPTRPQRRTHKGPPTVKPANLCRWHTLYGKEAFTCEAGCDKFPGSHAGNAKAGRQT